MTYMMKKHTTIFQFRPNGIKSLLLMLLLLFVGVGESVGQDIFTIHNTSISGVSLSWVTEDKCQIITTDDSDEAQQWIKEFVEGSTTDFYLKNVKSETYLAIADNDEDMTFVSSSELASKGNKAIFTLNDQGEGEYGIETKHQNKYLGTDAKTSGSLVYGNKEISANGKWAVNSRTTDYEPKYIAIHKKGVGYLKINSANVALSNDGNFRYGNAFDDNGNSIWVLTEEGYLKNQYYYLNVTNSNTLYLSVDPVTNWELEEIDDNGKMSIKYNDLYLASSSGIKLVDNADLGYHACPITITEKEWSGPTTNAVTVQSPQQITYLRHYYTQKMDYTFINDDGDTKTESGKDRRIYATLSHADADSNTDWGIVDGVIYNKKASGNVDVTETYSVSSSDPLANLNHAPENKSIKVTVQQKVFIPDATKNYLLFSIKGGDSDRYIYDDDIAENSTVKSDGIGGTGTNSVLTAPDTSPNQQISWKIETDTKGFCSFKNVSTGHYLCYDDTSDGTHYFGTLKVGATTIPADAEGNKYKFKLFKTSDGDFGDCYNIIPFVRQDAVYKNDGLAASLYSSLNNANYKNPTPKVISLYLSGDSKWCIFKYESEYRLRNSDDMSITGLSYVEATGTYTFTSQEGWYGKFIKQSKNSGNQQRAMVIKGTYTTAIDYAWTVTGLGNYISIDGGSYNADTDTWTKTINGNRNLVINVTSLPVASTSGIIQVQWICGTGDNKKYSGKKTFSFTIMGDGTVEVVEIDALSQITSANGAYKLSDDADVTYSETNKPTVETFSGILDGNNKTIIGLTRPLFTTLNNGTVRNLNIEGVNISMASSVGAVAGTANGGSRIYNVGILGGSVGSTDGNCGGLVGTLDGSARVINCFSYANITSGTNVGGIVGYNSYESKSNDIRTMVMNCMFYGNITGGGTKSPVYGGKNINNNQGGLNTFNYYSYENLTGGVTDNQYNCALAVEEKYLNRFEYYRLLLNSNKKLAAYYATGSADNGDKMAKWVLETADRTIDNPKPYPVLKAQGYYPSIINPDIEHAPDSASVGRNHGGKLGKTLTVHIGGVGSNAPDGASIRMRGAIQLQRTDKDFDRFNFNYDKVQLPYYNDVGTGNYTKNKVVTGWKITAITAIEGDPYTSANYPATGVTDYPNHNYADRKSSNKDLYSVSKRVFSQGAYFDVPYGVTSITIEPYWGTAVYVADQYYDVVYKNDYTGKQGVSQVGTQVVDNTTEFNGQKVRTSITGLGSGTTVYDNAVVLVGNFHLDGVPSGGTVPFTMMSVDMDNDHEPDYSLIYHHKGRSSITPIRFDFLNIPGTAQAQKPNGASLVCNFTIFKTKGWFEVTNTSSFYTSQLEYENLDNNTKTDAPLILLGGVVDQFVSTQSKTVTGKTIYIHVGGNVWINSFGLGTHSDGSQSTPHVPVSVTGGEYEGLYLTGTYNAGAAVRTDNAECYISGGYIHEAAKELLWNKSMAMCVGKSIMPILTSSLVEVPTMRNQSRVTSLQIFTTVTLDFSAVVLSSAICRMARR